MADAPTLYLIDGSNQMYRAYHAIRGLTGPDGRSTNAVYGFVTMLRKLVADHQPAYIAASFDLAGPTFRDDMAATYKANRAAMPDDLAEQVAWVHEACEALGVPIVTAAGFEADDVIGTLAKQAEAQGLRVAIVTGDKDMLQLVGDGIRVFNPRDEGAWIDADGVVERFGVPPPRVIDVLALTGDAIDNVKGVPGIGDKGARELIATYGSLDELLARAGEVRQKKYREGLLAHADEARQSRELVTIRTDVDVPLDLERFSYTGASRERCYTLFAELGFRSLMAEFAPTAATVARDYEIVATPEGLTRLAAELEAAGRFAMHIVNDDGGPMRAKPVGIAVSTRPRWARYVPVGHVGLAAETVGLGDALRILGPVFANAGVEKVGHDLKADMELLADAGVALGGAAFDTMLAAYLLDANRSSQELEPIVLEQLGYKALTVEAARGKGARAVPFAEVPTASILDYAGERADLAGQLAGVLAPAIAQEGLERVFRELELPLVPLLADIERAGVKVDTARLAVQGSRLDADLAALSTRIFDIAGGPFNIGSPRQIGEVLFGRLQLPVLKRTGATRSASTSVEVLEELAASHELPRLILDWRALSKLKGTYVDALPALVHPVTGRVHTRFNQAVAATGRLSSSEPNLQNIPIRTALGREIRAAFVAEPGHVLISADYSQIELRVLAHLSGDDALIEAFRRGDDIHDQTAARVFGESSGLDRHELRRRAKIVNYALLYGKTAFTLARDIGVTQAAAQQFIDAYFAGFPQVAAFLARTLEDARQTGRVRTLFGRRRAVPEITSRNGQIRSAAERIAVNMPIQGTAADILKRAMIDVAAALADTGARMILTVHDELLFEAPRETSADIAALVAGKMAGAAALSVPLDVDVGIGESWNEAKAG